MSLLEICLPLGLQLRTLCTPRAVTKDPLYALILQRDQLSCQLLPSNYAKSNYRLYIASFFQIHISASGWDVVDLLFTSVSRSLWPTDHVCVCEWRIFTLWMQDEWSNSSIHCAHVPCSSNLLCKAMENPEGFWRNITNSNCPFVFGHSSGHFPPPLHPPLIWCWKDMFLTYSFICFLSLLSFLWIHNVHTHTNSGYSAFLWLLKCMLLNQYSLPHSVLSDTIKLSLGCKQSTWNGNKLFLFYLFWCVVSLKCFIGVCSVRVRWHRQSHEITGEGSWFCSWWECQQV